MDSPVFVRYRVCIAVAVRTLAPILLILLAAVLPARSRADGTDPPGLSVLFVGNSFTRFNQLDRMVRRLAEHDPGASRLRARRETRPGCTLRRHWLARHAVAQIRGGAYTHVVLQGHSLRALDRPGELAEYARRFDEEIDRAGATTVLYSTWARHPSSRFYRRRADLDPKSMQERIDAVYAGLAEELGADVAPVGDAFLSAQRDAPDVRLHGRDGFHPTQAGSFLAACVLYRTLTGRSPDESTWHPFGMPAEVAATLKRVAR